MKLIRSTWLSLCLAPLGGCFTTLDPPARATTLVAREPPTAAADAWRDVLARHVNDQGLVDYAELAGDRDSLDRYIAQLAVTGPESTPELFPTDDDRLAFYVNAYNALVIFNVLSRATPESVAEHKVDFFYLTRFRLDGREVNLYDLENDIVRAQFQDPRVHMALNCGSHGCPALPRVPLAGVTLQAQLAAETARFLHDPRNVSVEDGTLVLSEIFQWYAEDFPPDPLTWIRTQAPDLQLPPDIPVRYRPYDWRLNAQPPGTAPFEVP